MQSDVCSAVMEGGTRADAESRELHRPRHRKAGSQILVPYPGQAVVAKHVVCMYIHTRAAANRCLRLRRVGTETAPASRIVSTRSRHYMPPSTAEPRSTRSSGSMISPNTEMFLRFWLASLS